MREKARPLDCGGLPPRLEAAPEDGKVAGFVDAANVAAAAAAAAVALRERRRGHLALRRHRRRGQRLVMDDGLVVLTHAIDSEFLRTGLSWKRSR
jgi:hypothetical protein